MDNVPSLEAWAKSLGGLSYPLASDFFPHGLVSLKYQVLRPDGLSERAIFVIDKDGVIRYIDNHDIGEQPPTDKIMDALDRLR